MKDKHPVDPIYLAPTRFIDSDSPRVIEFVRNTAPPETSDTEKAIKLFYAVRDGIKYDPYRIDIRADAYTAASVLERKYGYCVPKAILLTTAGRAAGIPSRLGFADVKNHLNSQRLRDMMQTDLFVYHGYTEFFLEDRWVKATPAFNRSLCKRFHVRPLEFDGKTDSVFQAFDTRGHRHMEYVRDHGTFADFPYDRVIQAYKTHYPRLAEANTAAVSGDFEADARPER